MPSGYSFVSKNYDKFQLIFVQSGILRITLYKRDIELPAGSVALLRQGSSFRLSSAAGYSGLGVIVENSDMPELHGVARGLQANVQMNTTVELMDHYMLMPDAESKGALRSLALALIWETMGLEKKLLSRHSEKWPQIAKAVLDVNLGTGVPARKALSHIPLCYRQLSRLFTASYGVSPKQYQVSARIEEAKRMLHQSNATITDVAMELGFSSSQHFATQFKIVTGMTPREFESSQLQEA